ncbi:MAG: hypothetical protein J2O48_10540, partial [Solirubrobacterales bacterium]|nr:hypothetical protein [Solirubrobacterales bacterium]
DRMQLYAEVVGACIRWSRSDTTVPELEDFIARQLKLISPHADPASEQVREAWQWLSAQLAEYTRPGDVVDMEQWREQKHAEHRGAAA